MNLRSFQRRFLSRALRPGIDTAALSLPRGNGKSWLAAHILRRCLTPGDRLYVAGAEYVLLAGSTDQARTVWRFLRPALDAAGGYKLADSANRIGARHELTGTALRVRSSNAKTAFGLVGVPLVVADEPGAWETTGGQLMADAIETAQGKPGSPLRVIYIGTLAPATAGWWPDLVEGGGGGSVYVQALQADPEKWDRWPEIRRCNPLTAVSADFRAKLLEERDKARRDTRLKARFLSYRLNVPTPEESKVLLTVDDWKRIAARPVPARTGRPIVGVDMGQNRAWSAAVALWRSGRVEARAVAPGIPMLSAQEKRDRVPRGTYAKLALGGALSLATGKRVPPADLIARRALEWRPQVIICDRARLDELRDAIGGRVRVVPRVTRWFEAAEDIRALRAAALDGPLAVDDVSRDLVAASLAVAQVRSDDQGSVRLVKRGSNNEARDDVAAALVLAAGAMARAPVARRRGRFLVAG